MLELAVPSAGNVAVLAVDCMNRAKAIVLGDEQRRTRMDRLVAFLVRCLVGVWLDRLAAVLYRWLVDDEWASGSEGRRTERRPL